MYTFYITKTLNM